VVDFVSNALVSNFSNDVAVFSVAGMPNGPQKNAAIFQCQNQRIQSSAEIQNFNFVGVIIVIVFSFVVIVIGLSLKRLRLLLSTDVSHRNRSSQRTSMGRR